MHIILNQYDKKTEHMNVVDMDYIWGYDTCVTRYEYDILESLALSLDIA